MLISAAVCHAQPPINPADVEKLPDDVAATVAIVGEDRILLGDLMPKIQARIDAVIDSNKVEVPEEQIKAARYTMLRSLLTQTIQNKRMRQSFLRDQVGAESVDKLAEADKQMTTRARSLFYDTELPKLQKQFGTTDLAEIDENLRKQGNSLETREREFVDMLLGHLYVRNKVKKDPEVSFSEINAYYSDHEKDYMQPSRARWEQLSVLFDNHPDRESAKRKIWDMGREAFFGGNMQAVAKKNSEEPFSGQGGLHNWTAKGSLASDVLDQQIFSIPLNEMSEIIEDANGLHIIRVLGREEAGMTSLRELQDQIREKIQQEKVEKSQKEVMEAMQSRIPVWTLFPDDVPGALPLPESVARHHKKKQGGKRR